MRELLNEIVWRKHIFALIRLFLTFLLLISAVLFYFNSRSEMIAASATYEDHLAEREDSEHAELILEQSLLHRSKLIS